MALFGKNTIVVGASHPNGTPDLKDDQMAFSSSTGTAEKHPTVSAPGHEGLVGRSLGLLAPNQNGVASGTFISASEVAGTVAVMLQKNPNLKLDDIQRILTTTAVDTDAPVESEGAGMLDPQAALQATPDPSAN